MDQPASNIGQIIALEDGSFTTSAPARVTNKTGLAGDYDFNLRYSFVMRATAATATVPSQSEPDGLNVFEAIEKQLGLKLEKGKTTVSVLVVDHALKIPTEN